MDNKTVIAVVLSFLVIVGFQFLFPGEPQKAPVQKPVEQQATEAAPKEVTQKTEPLKPVAETVVADEKEVIVENDLYTAVFTSRGGTIKSWTIKSYKDKTGKDVVLLKKPGIVSAVGLGTSSSFDLANVNFSVTGRNLKLDNIHKTGSLVFEYAKDGKSVRRTFTFSADTYKVDLVDEVSGFPEYWITLGSDFGIFEHDPSGHVGPTVLTGTNLKNMTAGDLKEPKVFNENLKWIAQQDKYFFSALVPASPV
ncbi:MAG: membrane protein insertase YidC, partial [Nitrospirota bacterium]|nr:membrane protein insertase YidC [Nitrospirota bacterium]